MGVEINLDSRSMPKPEDFPGRREEKRRDMAETGRRYFKKAAAMVAVTSTGRGNLFRLYWRLPALFEKGGQCPSNY